VQGRAWLWLYLYREGEWLGVEQPFLDFAKVRRPEIAYDDPGLSFAYRILEPLRRGHLRVQSSARVLSGSRAGRVVPVTVELEVTAIGAAHSTGPGDQEGHSSETYDARRMEQPIVLDGQIQIGNEMLAFEGRGERDHSWGPRYWLLEWSFFALNGVERRLQCVEVRFPGDGTIAIGYTQVGRESDGVTQEIRDVSLEITRLDGLENAFAGRCDVVDESGKLFGFTFEAIAAHEMDLSHVLEPSPPRSVYRRALIRAIPEDGSAPLIGWLEDHVMPDGVAR
ncbi:MAG: hypothetical protein N2037_14155, partial [Acidimicrobiales bacterium]|nr:hypothetical protein [Acidimicrobiales bacterium]